ncbi:PLP-dependent aminotransferase family protein [Nocardioides sp. DS6]|uniref:PLP-dependent aminotransferase family protein n=1 Tax=Nocardioides eburneus TaxID=3231482 RepID=A0ABV3T3P9_9ACTN
MARGRLGAADLTTMLGEWRTDAPAYDALAERLRLLLIDGRVSADVRLPSERDLSARLGLSRTTVTAAYGRLRERGYARSVQGSGTTTALPPHATSPADSETGIDLTKATLPATRLLADAAGEATERLTAHLPGSGYTLRGLPELRTAIADRYTERGLPTSPDQVLVTLGGQSAIALLGRVLIARGDRAYAESPSYPHAYDALRLAGARVVTSPVTTEQGWDLPALEAAISRTQPVMAYVMPDFHNPTGWSLDEEGRARLLRAAARTETIVVADDTTAELDIDRPVTHPPLAALAAGHRARVVHLGSASKQLWGGLRIGWIRAEPELLGRLVAQRSATDLGTPIWEQLVTALLLPRAAAVVEERRGQLRAGRTALYAAVDRLLPDWSLPARLHGGLTAWVHLPAPVSSQLTLAARGRGLLLTAGPRFGADGAYERHLRLPITAAPAEIERAVGILADLWPRADALPHALTAHAEAVV